MPSPTDKTLKLPVSTYELVRLVAAAESRTQRTVVLRALERYAPKVIALAKQQKEAA